MRLGAGQYEDRVSGWLLERLEQGVEGLVGQLVDFVDNVELEVGLPGGEVDLVA
jgi:hypothetical protein